MLYICKFGVNAKNIHTITQAYNIKTYKPSIEKEKIFDFFIHSYIHCGVLRYYRGLKPGDLFFYVICVSTLCFNFLKSSKNQDEKHKSMEEITNETQPIVKSEREILVTIQCFFLCLFIYLFLCCFSGLGD